MDASKITLEIPAQTGLGVELRAGDTMRVIAPFGEQVADVVAFAQDDRREYLSSGRTIDYNESILVTTGTTLYSNRSRPMMVMTADTAGRHDFLCAPCSQEMFELLNGVREYHPNCFDNLVRNLAPYDIEPDQIGTAFNIFMNVTVDGSGRIYFGAPSCSEGDYVDLRAELDLIVGVTACSSEGANNGTLKPIKLEITPAA